MSSLAYFNNSSGNGLNSKRKALITNKPALSHNVVSGSDIKIHKALVIYISIIDM